MGRREMSGAAGTAIGATLRPNLDGRPAAGEAAPCLPGGVTTLWRGFAAAVHKPQRGHAQNLVASVSVTVCECKHVQHGGYALRGHGSRAAMSREATCTERYDASLLLFAAVEPAESMRVRRSDTRLSQRPRRESQTKAVAKITSARHVHGPNTRPTPQPLFRSYDGRDRRCRSDTGVWSSWAAAVTRE